MPGTPIQNDPVVKKARLATLKLILGGALLLRDRTFEIAPKSQARNVINGVVIVAVVMINELEGKPPARTGKIAKKLGLPERTVLRKINELIKLDVLEKCGQGYVVNPNHMVLTRERAQKWGLLLLETFIDIAPALRQMQEQKKSRQVGGGAVDRAAS
jgi:hypothetical protein